ncbi:hypothetical protein CC1G_08803 [Coprinopsis cinerea okayama7|uniref:DUF6534 domain-containing protein n=1 Tax=Coprinopsis cinerea (strain Okayama-7 / 130 / ATCC MYA-4618 / FGSC 9003) TaxID=240176 RepID=A8N453_COPC7|nr:hypothetical protein CC1G_08803 [Coprinopsis cinerea okayama7\|eukprot:XP_001829648.2 hypothetical protein CC1G_08803 [Coprinopsis cinerea okayama7\
MAEVDIPKTFGALLIGGLLATLFSGLTQAQTFIFFRLYNNDPLLVKLLILGVWFLDSLHTIFIGHSLWNYLINTFGNAAGIDYIPTCVSHNLSDISGTYDDTFGGNRSLALTIAVTAVLTFCVHCFFIYRIFVLSRRNFFISVPLTLIACTRLCFACLTTAKLIELRSLEVFVRLYTWSFTTGLTLSAILDVLITVFMCWFLKRRQKEFSKLNKVLDALILYAFENGILTTLAALLTLIFWLSMRSNLIFMAAHFIIIKFYANSLLATLNARRDLQSEESHHGTTMDASGVASGTRRPDPSNRIRHIAQPIDLSEGFRISPIRDSGKFASGSDLQDDDDELKEVGKTSQLRINVNTSTVRVTDSLGEGVSGSRR